jgi:hypothetical protein
MIDLTALPKTHLLDESATAEALGVKPGTLSVWRSTSRYDLPHLKIGRRVKYQVSDILCFMQSSTKSGA